MLFACVTKSLFESTVSPSSTRLVMIDDKRRCNQLMDPVPWCIVHHFINTAGATSSSHTWSKV